MGKWKISMLNLMIELKNDFKGEKCNEERTQ